MNFKMGWKIPPTAWVSELMEPSDQERGRCRGHPRGCNGRDVEWRASDHEPFRGVRWPLLCIQNRWEGTCIRWDARLAPLGTHGSCPATLWPRAVGVRRVWV